MAAAKVALDVLLFGSLFSIPREMQLSHAAFVVSALELMAQPRELPSVMVDGVNIGAQPSPLEQVLAGKTRMALQDPRLTSHLDGEAFSLMAEAWRRVERSGAFAMRMLGRDPLGARTIAAGLDAAAAEGAVRGLRECALASCAAKEVHVSQFKRCSACHQAYFCCREHQQADWPSHKAACRAAH